MTNLINYFESERADDKRELQLVKQTIKKVSGMFPEVVLKNRWPYELYDRKQITIPSIYDKDTQKYKLSYSHSTNAMILFSLIASSGNAADNCPLIPKANLIEPFNFQNDKSTYEKIWQELKCQIIEEHDKKKQISYSSTFGINDPLTLSWLIEIERSNSFNSKTEPSIKELLIGYANGQIQRILELDNNGELNTDWLIWSQDKQRQSIDHAFLLLRHIQLTKCLNYYEQMENIPLTSLNRFIKYFDNRIHEQLSKFEIRDGDFDAAELVFALEGLLLLKPLSISQAQLSRIFYVITESQDKNPYWRPVKPIVATPQGRVLFPLSVETASSLLRCCNIIEKEFNDPSYFSQNVDLFRRYSEWLRSRRTSGEAIPPGSNGENNNTQFCGWHSEHVHIHPGIHLWETANVLLFFHYYSLMLEKHIAQRSLQSANLFGQYPWKENQKSTHVNYWKEERDTVEPFKGEYHKKLQPYLYAEKHIINPRTPSMNPLINKDEIAYSILLYGPPGTGKTIFAEEICKALQWPLITVTPSDFIQGGESEVEARAKRIFEVLEDQFDVVILLDEIDRMILDRSSGGYNKQGDFFQFMTPSMLTKLRNLRKKERVIFIIATNYKERIDPAAIRKGRIDEHLLMSAPNREGRIEILKRFILEKLKSDELLKKEFEKKSDELLTNVANKTSLYIFGELQGLFHEAIMTLEEAEKSQYEKIIEALDASLKNKAVSENITLVSYKSRFEDSEQYSQKPFAEFLLLLYIKLQGHNELDKNEKDLVKTVFNQLINQKKDRKIYKTSKKEVGKKILEKFPEFKDFTQTIVECLK